MQKSFAAALAQERLRESKVAAAIGDNVALNRAVEILFILSTCKEGCRGGAHVLENLLGRILNHVTVGIMADAAGFHDEALSLLRSTGEITNLLALFRLDAKAYGQWVGASEGDRRRTFSPVKVRLAVDKHRTIAVPMDQEMYERLCERYAHCTPSTSPNSYGPGGLRHVGGYVQEAGSDEFNQTLTYIVLQGAMLGASLLQKQDLQRELVGLLNC
jgi:hypothetical protein